MLKSPNKINSTQLISLVYRA